MWDSPLSPSPYSSSEVGREKTEGNREVFPLFLNQFFFFFLRCLVTMQPHRKIFSLTHLWTFTVHLILIDCCWFFFFPTKQLFPSPSNWEPSHVQSELVGSKAAVLHSSSGHEQIEHVVNGAPRRRVLSWPQQLQSLVQINPQTVSSSFLTFDLIRAGYWISKT